MKVLEFEQMEGAEGGFEISLGCQRSMFLSFMTASMIGGPWLGAASAAMYYYMSDDC